MMRAFTSQDDQEIEQLLQLLVNSSAGTGFMHESFSVNDVKVYSRSWFAWANGQFGELLLALISEKPHLVIKNDVNSLQIARSVIKVPVSISAINNPLVL